jgi:succinoglycan biosynthesis transport protein ExoP
MEIKDNYDGLLEEVHLRDYWHLILKWRWTIFTIFTIVVTTVTIGTFSMKPVYKATATIQIEKEAPKVLSFEDVLPTNTQSDDYYQTQYGILKSRTLAQRVINKLSLEDHPQFKDVIKLVTEANAEATDPVVEEKRQKEILKSFLDSLEVEPVRNSRLVGLSFNSNYPELSSMVANALSKAYIDFTLESKYKAADKAKDWLSEQLGELQAKVETSEERLQVFARQNGIFSLEKDENLIIQKLEKIDDALSDAEAERISAEAVYKEVANKSVDNLPVNLEDDFIKRLKEQYALLEAEYQKLSSTYKPEYPKMVRLQNQMESIEKRIRGEIQSNVEKTEAAYNTALTKEKLLKDSFDMQNEMALKMKENSIQYNILKREVDTNKELYDGLLQRLKETGVSAGLDSSNIQIVDAAEPPLFPSKPRKKLNILLSMIVGLTMGIGMAFFFEYMDNTIKDPKEMERYLNVSALGLIPSLKSVARKNAHPEQSPTLISFLDKKSALSEAFRTLRTSILFSSPGKPPKTILITSALPGEGKTTVSVNLGIVMAQAGKRVLIIDGDLRKASCHEALSIPSSPGLTNYLTGNSDIKSIVRPTKVPSLYLAPAGPIPPNPTELLASPQLSKLLKVFKAHFDFIIIDSPPVMGFADSPTITTLVDGVVPVVYGGETPKEEIANAIHRLKAVNAHILGAVLNKLDIKKHSYNYYGFYHYYGKGYGDDDHGQGKAAYRAGKNKGAHSISV